MEIVHDPRPDGPSAGPLRRVAVFFAGCEFVVEFDDLALYDVRPYNDRPEPWEVFIAERHQDDLVQLATTGYAP